MTKTTIEALREFPSPYAERDIMALDREGGHYMRHVSAMTHYKLHGKSEIAAELAWRDARIAELEATLAVLSQGEGEVVCSVCEELVEKIGQGYVPRGHGVYSKPGTDHHPEAQQPEAVAWRWRDGSGDHGIWHNNQPDKEEHKAQCLRDGCEIEYAYDHPTTPTHDGGGVTDEMVERARSAAMSIKHNKEPWFPMTDRRLRRAIAAALTPATPQGGK